MCPVHVLDCVLVTWLLSRIVLAVERGDLGADNAAMICMYDKITALRGTLATLSDMYDGRMPLAYVHFVNLLVEALIHFRFTLGGVLRLWVLSHCSMMESSSCH